MSKELLKNNAIPTTTKAVGFLAEKQLKKGIHYSPKTEFNGDICYEKHPGSKLTLNDVNSIREEYKTTNVSQRKLAKKYNVTQRQIFRIVNINLGS